MKPFLIVIPHPEAGSIEARQSDDKTDWEETPIYTFVEDQEAHQILADHKNNRPNGTLHQNESRLATRPNLQQHLALAFQKLGMIDQQRPEHDRVLPLCKRR
ncbi:MAG: hypothetical protein ABSA85_09525 [Terracidiphilus sp.]|jgi:hypothetical protein